MTAQPKPSMTVDEFLAWSELTPGRFELLDGKVLAMSPERTRHAEVKLAVLLALRSSIRAAGVPCRLLPEGPAVRIDERTAYEPDALVYCGERNPPGALDVSQPVLVVEVLSPSTRGRDLGRKLADYFKVPSIVHYLVIDADSGLIIHHRRGVEGAVETRFWHEGAIALDPPGLQITVADIFAEP